MYADYRNQMRGRLQRVYRICLRSFGTLLSYRRSFLPGTVPCRESDHNRVEFYDLSEAESQLDSYWALLTERSHYYRSRCPLWPYSNRPLDQLGGNHYVGYLSAGQNDIYGIAQSVNAYV